MPANQRRIPFLTGTLRYVRSWTLTDRHFQRTGEVGPKQTPTAWLSPPQLRWLRIYTTERQNRKIFSLLLQKRNRTVARLKIIPGAVEGGIMFIDCLRGR